jgi:hypothetical protein
MPQLRIFYENVSEREAVHAYMIETLKEIAVEKAFNGESTAGIKEASTTIERLFDKLEQEYGKIQSIKESNSR